MTRLIKHTIRLERFFHGDLAILANESTLRKAEDVHVETLHVFEWLYRYVFSLTLVKL